VLIDGRDIREFTLESLRGQIGVVLQDNLLFSGLGAGQHRVRCPRGTTADIEAAARLAHAHEFIVALPQGTKPWWASAE
jgi:ABC-type multidrug transport system fused ATPase/permease subunit